MSTSISSFRSTWWWWDGHTVAVIASLVVRAVVCAVVRAVVCTIVCAVVHAVVCTIVRAVVGTVVGTVVRAVVGTVVCAVVGTGVVVRSVVSASRNSGCINAIIKTAVLGDCDIYRLVISGCVHLQ